MGIHGEEAARIPGFNFPPTAELAGPAGKITPLTALARAVTLISVSQLPLRSQGHWHSHWERAAGRDLPRLQQEDNGHGAAQNHTGSSWLWTAEEEKQANLLKREHFTLTAKIASPMCKRLRRYLWNNFIF